MAGSRVVGSGGDGGGGGRGGDGSGDCDGGGGGGGEGEGEMASEMVAHRPWRLWVVFASRAGSRRT
jgi:hypothetical protein